VTTPGTANIKRVTPNYNLKVPMFDSPLWGRLIEQDLDIIDAGLFAATGLGNVVGIWSNSTTYEQGQRVVDDLDNTMWQCQITHVSSPVGSFAATREANPTYWTATTSSASFVGQWQTEMTYNINEFLLDAYRYGVVRDKYVSSASYDADVLANHIVTLVDLTDPMNLATTSAASASTSASSASGAASTASAAAASASTSASSATNSLSLANAAAAAAQSSEDDAQAAQAAAEAALAAMMPDAASDGKSYGRKNADWAEVVPEAVADGVTYGRKSGTWVPTVAHVYVSDVEPPTPRPNGMLWYESDTGNTFMWYTTPTDPDSSQWVQISGFSAYASGVGGGIAEAPTDGQTYARRDNGWISMGGAVPVNEAPNDGKQYVRKNQAWAEVVFPTPPSTPFILDANGDAVVKFGATIVVRIKPSGLILTKDDIEIFSVSV
jgi:hypothetical protein